MFPASSPGGPLDERRLIYEALVDEDAAPPTVAGDDEADEADETDEGPTAFACLGCATVTTARDRPESCPACHRTPGDRRGGALFQRID